MDFSTALSTWKDINLSELQRSLDATALELVENQKENMVGRKKLAEQTREFKKIPEETKIEGIKPLLKAYQTEIDQLTRRSKVSESAFLNAYKLLAEAPDPYPLLDAAVDQTVKVAEARVLESELTRLREENLDLKRQVGEIAGVEEKRKKAEAKVETLEEKMDELIQERVTSKENELNATYDERMRNYEDREQDLQKQVKTVKDQLRDLRTSNDSTQAQLMDHSQRQDVEVVAKLGELDLIVADLERANARVASVERRNVRSSSHPLRSFSLPFPSKHPLSPSNASLTSFPRSPSSITLTGNPPSRNRIRQVWIPTRRQSQDPRNPDLRPRIGSRSTASSLGDGEEFEEGGR
ncbi:hypothetical protein BDY24DRAFT_142500 [Mrakia frigida]|uniref:uncharacterized protein n=1 Tax=Mrakia frigida TaxID=29902 RepID=UPI003FCC26A3